MTGKIDPTFGWHPSNASVLSEARIRDGVRSVTMLWRAFVCGGRGLWEFNRFGGWKSLQRRDLREKLVIDAHQCTAPGVHRVMVRRGCSSFKRRDACTYTRGSVRRASGFVLTGNPEIEGLVLSGRRRAPEEIRLPRNAWSGNYLFLEPIGPLGVFDPRGASPRPPDRPDLPGRSSSAEELIAAIGLES